MAVFAVSGTPVLVEGSSQTKKTVPVTPLASYSLAGVECFRLRLRPQNAIPVEGRGPGVIYIYIHFFFMIGIKTGP